MEPTKKFDSAEELVDFFKPNNSEWAGSKYLFRGHREEDWPLLPALYRDPKVVGEYFENSLNKYSKNFAYNFLDKSDMIAYSGNEGELWLQAFKMYNFEYYLKYRFIEKANELGFSVVGAEEILNRPNIYDRNLSAMIVLKGIENNASSFPEPKLPELFTGLIQHHGIPTRLLDFSTNPYSALFFASIYSKDESSHQVEIYATPQNIQQMTDWAHRRLDYNKELISATYSLLRMPNSYNNYLYKQGGVFLYPKYPYDFFLKFGRYPSLMDHAKMMSNNNDDIRTQYLKLFTMPGSEKPRLREILKSMGITKSSLMPTLDNIGIDLQDDLSERTDFRS